MLIPPGQSDESARRSSRGRGRIAPIEMITRNGRRRWSLEQKREIVAESLGRGLTPIEVARKHAISSGQLYTWRRELLTMQTAMITRTAPKFAEVEILSRSAQFVGDDAALARTQSSSSLSGRLGGLIEVVLPGGVVVRVDTQVDVPALRRVLDALDGR